MAERNLPQGAKNWLPELILAAQCRYTLAVKNNYRNQEAWGDAVRLLQQSQKPIYIQRSVQNAGTVKGIPTKIDNQEISQVLQNVVYEREPILKDGVVIAPGQNLTGPGGGSPQDILEAGRAVRTMKYRDSTYALLAALYENYQGPGRHSDMGTKTFQQSAAKYTDLDIVGNWRMGPPGAWKAKDKLVKKGWCDERRENGNNKFYHLTQLGARVAAHIFTKFCPPDYNEVKNAYGTITADGLFHPNGAFGYGGGGGGGGAAAAGGKVGVGAAVYEGGGSTQGKFSSSSRKPSGSASTKKHGDGQGQAASSSSSSSSSSRLNDSDLRLARVKHYEKVPVQQDIRQDPKAIAWVQKMMIDMSDYDMTEEQAWNLYVPDQPQSITSDGVKAAAGNLSAASSAFVDITEEEPDDEDDGVQMMLYQEAAEKKAQIASASAKKRPHNDNDNTSATSVKRSAAAMSSSSSNSSPCRNTIIVIDDSQQDDDDDVETVPSGV